MKHPILFLIIISLAFISCNKDESCDTNATLNGDGFNLDVTFEVQSSVGQSS